MGRGRDSATSRKAQGPTFLSREEVAKHNTMGDAWVIVDGRVIDVSDWAEHPGGRVVFTVARQIGTVAPVEPSAFDKEVLELRKEFRKNGWFNASPFYYTYKTAEVLGIAAAGVFVLHSFPHNWFAVIGAALLLATAWQQAGWLSHDFMHHQVFENRLGGDIMGLFLGNFIQGFSVDWWKNKHNTHHSIPNLHESEDDLHDGDPDIDTLPFLAWSTTMADKARRDPSGWSAFFVRNQQMIFFPLLSFARLTWAQQSIAYALAPLLPETARGGAWGGGRVAPSLRYPVAELVGLAAHYTVLLVLAYLYMTPIQAIAYFLTAQMVCGLMLAVSFVVGHNGMECFDKADKPGFFELQLRATRNVTDDCIGFAGWFTGGLHLQVEHHLFPTMPRHHLAKAAPIVEALCKKHGVRYHSQPLLVGVWEVLECLDVMAQPVIRALHEFPAM